MIVVTKGAEGISLETHFRVGLVCTLSYCIDRGDFYTNDAELSLFLILLRTVVIEDTLLPVPYLGALGI